VILDVEEQRQHISYCQAEFLLMGMKRNLEQSTQNYIGKVCQPTIANICQKGRSWPASGTGERRVRQDLWRNATISIAAEEFAGR
jgi:hypothetical protein